jgi:cyanophycinase
MRTLFYCLSFCSAMIFMSCETGISPETMPTNTAKGKLYIIGGGKRPAAMIEEMARLAQLNSEGAYAVVLPMASAEPDTSFYYLKRQFQAHGNYSMVMFNPESGEDLPAAVLDSIGQASMVYITGGDQNRFMQIVLNTPLHDAIRMAYQQGALIAGTSAGAAVQSKKMITGNEHKYAEYTGNYRTIEADNIEISEGLGLIETAIIDQHFIWRMRMNRLISAAIENPDEMLIGIDESTAIIVEGDSATVTGISQVVVLHNKNRIKHIQEGLLGSQGMELSVYLPDERFSLRP